jgi:hypothetical protein
MSKAKILVSAAAVLAAGCSHSSTVSEIATDYNRAMATSRDEQLLINVLRASGREPLMFSAIGEVTGSAQDKLTLQTAATNLLAGGKDMITPTLGLEGSSGPTVKVTPLSSKEFTEGILKPIKPETLNYFINQGWDEEFLLPLVLASYRCADGASDSLNGPDAAMVAAWGAKFTLTEASEGPSPAVIRLAVTDAEALEMLRTGVVKDYKVKSVEEGAEPHLATVILTPPEEKGWSGNFRDEDSDDVRLRKSINKSEVPCLAEKKYGVGSGKSSLQLRSVEGVLYYLGETVRPCFLGLKSECEITYRKMVKPEDACPSRAVAAGSSGPKSAVRTAKVEEGRTLFRIRSGSTVPSTAAIQTRYAGNHFWIDRLDLCDSDRSLKTLSFLSQLIALQTEASDLAVTPSVIAVNPR